MSLDKNYSSWITGLKQKTQTLLGATPPINSEGFTGLSVVDAPFSSCTITASAAVTYGAITYADGDVLFSSDANEIYDSTGAVMSGSLKTGAVRGAPQAVAIVKVTDALSSSIGKEGQLFWVFSNCMIKGLTVGLIDMALNGGLGEFSNSSLSGLTPSGGGALGTVKGSETGMGGRMITCCKRDNDTDEIIGTIVIYKNIENSGGSNWVDNGWMANSFTEIAANGFPDITAVSAQPVNSPVGITVSSTTDAGVHGVVAITPQNNNPLDSNKDKYKLATIYREFVGSGPTNLVSAMVEVLTFDQDSLVISNPQTKLTRMIDKGPVPWPHPSSTPSRFYGMGLEFSHSSTHDNAFLYYPDFEDSLIPGGTLLILWNQIDAGNTWNTTVGQYGSMEITDNSGTKIWGGPSQAGRILAGIWRDPSKSGRLFVATPEVTGIFNLAVGNETKVWSMSYPELYGTNSNPNDIQHCILENCDNPVVSAPTQTMVGTLDVDTYYQYGAPSFTVCEIAPTGATLDIQKCPPPLGWAMDTTKGLWKMEINLAGQVLNQVSTIATLVEFISLTHDRVRDMLYIWDRPSGGPTLSYQKYNTNINTITNPTAIGGGALGDYASISTIDSNSYIDSTTVNPTNPTDEKECIEHMFMGLKAATTDKFSLGIIDVSTNSVTAYNVTYEYDTTTDDGGALAGKLPRAITTIREIANPPGLGGVWDTWVAFDDRIIKTDATGTWTLLASVGPATYTSLFFVCDQVTPTSPKLYATAGPAGANKLYSINLGSGAATLVGVGDLITDPGGFIWPDLIAGQTWQNGFAYYDFSPLRLDSTLNPSEYHYYANLCKTGVYDIWWQAPTSDHVGCFKCGTKADNYHLLTSECDWQPAAMWFDNCRVCADIILEECRAFLPCCNITVGAVSSGFGPMQLPGIAVNNAASFVPGNIYDVSFGGSAPICATAVFPIAELWFSHSDGKMYRIDNLFSGSVSEASWSVNNGPFMDLEDIAFDKHGNIIFTHNTNDISWASAWPGYQSVPTLITGTFPVPQCLDTDYTSANHIVAADMNAGSAEFRTYTNDINTGLTLVASYTNATISTGYDLSVDYNSGNYFTLGDFTGAGGLDDLMNVDSGTGIATLISNLATVCSFAASQHAYGIERVRDTGATSVIYIISGKSIAIGQHELYLHTLNDAGTSQAAVVGLINPSTATNNWPDLPTGMAYSDICSKWPLNIDPPANAPWDTCDVCVADHGTEDCCYKLTNCITGAIQYSNQVILDPFVGYIVRLVADTCWEVERVPTCIAPVTVILHATPGPFVDCVTCEVPPTVCYKLPNCNDASDIVYTDDVLTPTIGGIYAGGLVVQLTGECFCREIIINTCTGSEVALSIQNTLPNCGYYCKWNINLINCVTGAIVSVDANTSPTVAAAAGGAEAYEITVGGLVPDAVNLCWEKLDPCQGPHDTTYPVGVVTATHTDCTVCQNSGQTCVVVSHCCGTGYVLDQIVDVATGITTADIGFVVQADIIVAGTLYTGCWTVSANSPVGDCIGVLPNGDVNAINTATVGTGNFPDCTYCPTSPCPPACTLLESCQNPGTFITVDGATGAAVGSDVVNLFGYNDCWKACISQGNPIAGSYWFYGQALGMDFTSGNAVADFAGNSQMLTYNASNALNSDVYSFRGTAVHSATGTATIGGHAFTAGDLMFYTDGHLIYDRTHTLMNTDAGPAHKGDANVGLTGDQGRTFPAQGAVIIPVAGGGVTNNVWHQYYVIQNSCGNGPIKWSIIDMTLNSGKGEVLNASANTLLVTDTSAAPVGVCEYMCVSTTFGVGAAAHWNLFYVPAMASSTDSDNAHIAGIKFDAAGIGTAFIAVDCHEWVYCMDDSKSRGSGELLINQSNDILAFKHCENTAGNSSNDNFIITVWGLNPITGLSATASIGVQVNNGWNGGAGNGVYSWIIGTMYQEQNPISGQYVGYIGVDQSRAISFSPDGKSLWLAGASYYDPGTPFDIADPLAGTTVMALAVHALGVEYYITQNQWLTFNSTADPNLYGTYPEIFFYMDLANQGLDRIKMFPDASSASGWYGGTPPADDRCNVMVNDITFAPDGKLWMVFVEQTLNMPWSQSIGAGDQITNSLVRFDAPNLAFGITDNITGAVAMPAHDIGSRRMGERFPVWLSMPCPCDPINIVPVAITNTLPDCASCAPPPQGCYLLTECECTGGSSGANPCSVNDPATMPPNMITYGKTWSPTCNFGSPVRWQAITDAVALLGTSAAPGIAQTVTWSYSLINGGATFVGMPGGFGPSQTVTTANGPGATGIGPPGGCIPYNKTYVISDADFQTEMAAMFAYVKDFFEGMFNTSCGYGADLTVNFTALGYETGYTAGDDALAAIAGAGNGTSFTDVNGVAGIGDFRVGLADFGGIESCGASGNAGQVLGLCFVSDLNACDPGIAKAGGHSGQLLFDANEDWRRAGDPVVANSFSLIRVGIHEILHAFGFGHDWLTFGPLAGQCDCPCFQSDPSCPSMYPTPPGAVYNPDALMGPFSSNNSFINDFPGGLMGVNGMYDRRAMCGIYGNPNANYACEDGVCLQTGGCVYITHYSDDPALAAYVGGIISWDDGSAAGERCWEVDFVNPCPGGVPLVNPVNIVMPAGPTLDCTNCNLVDPCYTLNLCACNTVAGAPAQIITDTDLSLHCNGTIGNGTVVEVDLFPGACYEIDCTPNPCPAAGVLTVVVTNSYPDCQDCCIDNTVCYQICPCGPAVTSDTCSTLTEINVGVSTGAGAALQFISDVANTPLNVTDMATLKYGNNVQSGGSLPCVAPGGGFYRQFLPVLPNSGTFACYQAGLFIPPPGLAAGYNKWTDFLADCVTLGIAGVSNPGTPYFGINTLINTHFGYTNNVSFAITGDPCECTTAATCTVVTDDLSAYVGQVITLGGAPAPPLDTTTCYEVQVCGPCATAPCIPTVAIGPPAAVYPDCPTCDNGTSCDCYRLVDCTDSNIIINNVCSSVDLALANILGSAININGNTTQCWYVECESVLICNPATCVTVAVTNTYVDCSACLGTQLWECDYPGSCDCVPAAGPGPNAYVDCVTMFANTPDCCPTQLGVNCEQQLGATCACVPCFVGPCDYNTGVPAADMLACVSDTTTCCGPTIPESYNCVWDQSLSVYTCLDPGNGTGTFVGPTSLVDCQNCVINNCPDCYIESWDCVTTNGVSTCVDPTDGSGTWNNGNGGLAACVACNGCPLDPTCVGVIPNYDCHPVNGCIVNWNGTGQYTTLADCAVDCASYDPGEGTFEGDCENCLTEIEMKAFFDKVADVCDDCNVPFGLTDQEVTCDTGCFGQSNIYVFLDITSTFGGTYLNRLQEAVNFKTNVIEPAYMQIQSEFPQYNGKLYIIPGGWPYGTIFGPCTDSNGTGTTPPGSPTAPEDWLAWASYPLSGNKGANGAGPNPMATGTLPGTQRTVMGQTMVDGIGGPPVDCNGTAYDASVHGPLLEQLMILPGSYSDDGFTQLNPWQDGVGKEGMSDPYHEFEGGDVDSIVIIFQDECRTPGNFGYYEDAVGSNQFGGLCDAVTWAGVQPVTSWNGWGTDPGNVLAPQWKTDYNNYMSLHEFGWDASGVANPTPWTVTQKTMIYAGSWDTPSTHVSKIGFIYHLFGAVGAQTKDANISYQGHIDCADYVGVPAAFGYQCHVACDQTIPANNVPNPYMGASGGGDPSLVTGYQGGSLSNYGMAFHIPDQPIASLTSTMLYDLWKEYLSDC